MISAREKALACRRLFLNGLDSYEIAALAQMHEAQVMDYLDAARAMR